MEMTLQESVWISAQLEHWSI